MKRWVINFALLTLWLCAAIAHYHRGEFFKVIAAGIALAFLGHIIVGVCRGLLWLLRTLIIADMSNKLRKEM